MKHLKLFILFALLGLCGNVFAQGDAEVTEYSTIKAMKAAYTEKGATSMEAILNLKGIRVTLTHKNGGNFYIEDADGGAALYIKNNGELTKTFSEGQVFTAGKWKMTIVNPSIIQVNAAMTAVETAVAEPYTGGEEYPFAHELPMEGMTDTPSKAWFSANNNAYHAMLYHYKGYVYFNSTHSVAYISNEKQTTANDNNSLKLNANYINGVFPTDIVDGDYVEVYGTLWNGTTHTAKMAKVEVVDPTIPVVENIAALKALWQEAYDKAKEGNADIKPDAVSVDARIDLSNMKVTWGNANDKYVEDETGAVLLNRVGTPASSLSTGATITSGEWVVTYNPNGDNNPRITAVKQVITAVTVENYTGEEKYPYFQDLSDQEYTKSLYEDHPEDWAKFVRARGYLYKSGSSYYISNTSDNTETSKMLRAYESYAPANGNKDATAQLVGKMVDVYGAWWNNGIHATEFIEVPSYALTTADTDYYSIYLGFNAIKPAGVTLYTGKIDKDNEQVVTSEVTLADDIMPANTAFLLKADEAAEYTFYQTEKEAQQITENDLHGVTEETAVADIAQSGKIILTFGLNSANELGFRKPQSGNVDANKVYIYVDQPAAGASAKFYSIGAGSGTTGISSVTTVQDDKNAPTYNLAGQRVSGNAKGLLIRNGKKFIRK